MSNWMRKLEENEPEDPHEKATYWAEINVRQAKRAYRLAIVSASLMGIVAILLTISAIFL